MMQHGSTELRVRGDTEEVSKRSQGRQVSGDTDYSPLQVKPRRTGRAETTQFIFSVCFSCLSRFNLASGGKVCLFIHLAEGSACDLCTFRVPKEDQTAKCGINPLG